MSDRETDEDLAYRLGITLGMDYSLPVTHPIVKRATNPIIVTSNPGGPAHSWVRDRFIEKGHTMPTDQTQINLDWIPNAEHQPAARNADPSTSHAAAASVRGTETIRGRVYQILSIHKEGLTHEQIVEAYNTSVTIYGWPPAADQSIRSRTKELERDGFVKRNSKAVDKTAAGRLTHRWFAVLDYDEVQRRRIEGPAAKPITIEDVPREVQQRIINRFLADLEAEHQRPSGQHPAPHTPEAINALAEDINEGRTAGWFKAIDLAKFLVARGWQ